MVSGVWQKSLREWEVEKRLREGWSKLGWCKKSVGEAEGLESLKNERSGSKASVEFGILSKTSELKGGGMWS